MPESTGGRERRKFPRFPGSGECVKFRRLNTLPSGEPDVYHMGGLLDLSKGGMCFQTNHAISRGEKIEYYLSSSSGKGDRNGVARIIRVNREPERFFVAVEFIG